MTSNVEFLVWQAFTVVVPPAASALVVHTTSSESRRPNMLAVRQKRQVGGV